MDTPGPDPENVDPQPLAACAYCGRALPVNAKRCPYCRGGSRFEIREETIYVGDRDRSSDGQTIAGLVMITALFAILTAVLPREVAGFTAFALIVCTFSLTVLWMRRLRRSSRSIESRPTGCLEILVSSCVTAIILIIGIAFAIYVAFWMICILA